MFILHSVLSLALVDRPDRLLLPRTNIIYIINIHNRDKRLLRKSTVYQIHNSYRMIKSRIWNLEYRRRNTEEKMANTKVKRRKAYLISSEAHMQNCYNKYNRYRFDLWYDI